MHCNTRHHPARFFTGCQLLILALTLWLGTGTAARADFFDDIYDGLFGPSEEEKTDDTPTAQGAATTTDAASTEGEHEPYRETLSDARLIDILESQDALFEEMAANSAHRSEAEYERRLQVIATEYDSFLLDNPEYVYGYLLYGKFLRSIGETKAANKAFMKANMLDPNLAVAKQQIGNYLAEEGEYALALPYYLAAIDLEPEEPLYRYELGELLSRYRKFYIDKGIFEPETLDRNMLDAFHSASQLAPANRDYHIRYAEAFFEVEDPDWQDALNQWRILGKGVTDPLKLDLIHLQEARVLIKMGRTDEARQVLATVERPSLQEARAEVEAELGSASARAQP